jgi:hypothetical protein
MRLFKFLGLLLGSSHIVLYFALPIYASYLDKFAPMLICLPVMFFFGFCWPLLLFFAFAPDRYHQDPEAQHLIDKLGRAFHIRVTGLSLRITSLVLLWPFSIMNFMTLYHGLKE